jgi:predicted deacylase
MTVSYRAIPVDGSTPLPATTVEGTAPGPHVVVTANLHGDELTGLAACARLVERLDGAVVRGRVTLLGTLNPAGLADGVRTVPADGADLNRLFPGRRRGRGSERLAAAIWDALVGLAPRVVLDLHADSAASIPYVLVDRPVRLGGPERGRLADDLDALAGATGLTVVHEYEEEQYLRYALDRSLSGALVNRAGVPALTLEAGPRRAVDPAAVAATVGAVQGVLGALGVTEAGPTVHPSRREGRWRRVAGPRAAVAGWWDPAVEAGASVAAGERIGALRRADGRALDVVRSPTDGIVVSWIEGAWVAAGNAVGTLAVPEGSS